MPGLSDGTGAGPSPAPMPGSTVEEALKTLLSTGFCLAMLEAMGSNSPAEDKQCWERLDEHEDWCWSCQERWDALATVRGEIERLTEERDAARRERGVACTWAAELAGEKSRLSSLLESTREGLPRLLRWIDLLAPESLVNGRGNDEYFDVRFRASDIWNLRHAADPLRALLTASSPGERKPEGVQA